MPFSPGLPNVVTKQLLVLVESAFPWAGALQLQQLFADICRALVTSSILERVRRDLEARLRPVAAARGAEWERDLPACFRESKIGLRFTACP